jgi:hypothetical protein
VHLGRVGDRVCGPGDERRTGALRDVPCADLVAAITARAKSAFSARKP